MNSQKGEKGCRGILKRGENENRVQGRWEVETEQGSGGKGWERRKRVIEGSEEEMSARKRL